MLEPEREEIAAAGRRLAAAGYVPRTSGNVSVRCGDRFLLSGRGTRLADLRPDQLVVCDLAGHRIEGTWEPSSEVRMHVGLYARSEIGAIVHTHAPYATALACVLHAVGDVPVVAYEPAGSAALAGAAAAALRDGPVALLANHGTLATGADLAEALARTESLERVCTHYFHATLVPGT